MLQLKKINFLMHIGQNLCHGKRHQSGFLYVVDPIIVATSIKHAAIAQSSFAVQLGSYLRTFPKQPRNPPFDGSAPSV